VRSLPLSSLWPHLSASSQGSVIPTAASDSLAAPFVRPAHHHGMAYSSLPPSVCCVPIREVSTIRLLPGTLISCWPALLLLINKPFWQIYEEELVMRVYTYDLVARVHCMDELTKYMWWFGSYKVLATHVKIYSARI